MIGRFKDIDGIAAVGRGCPSNMELAGYFVPERFASTEALLPRAKLSLRIPSYCSSWYSARISSPQ